MTDRELAWAAGLFEGEGTIAINKPRVWKEYGKPRRGKPGSWLSLGALYCSVSNTDREVIEFFHQRWGGSLKAGLGYGDCDAVEVYPRDRDVVNVAAMRHLWVLSGPLPFAWRADARERAVAQVPA